MRQLLAGDASMSQHASNFLLVPIPEYPLQDSAPNKVIKIVVLGGSGVGKTALVVRFLTKRFIGDYEPNTGNVCFANDSCGSIKFVVSCAVCHLNGKQCDSQRCRVQSWCYCSDPDCGGALYSRKLTIEGEQVSLQVQDTPFVSLEDDTDNICCAEQINRSIYWADGFVLAYSIADYDSYKVIRPLYQHLRKIHPNANFPLLLIGNKEDLLRARQVSASEGLQLANEISGTYCEVSAREHFEGVHEAFHHLCQEMSRMMGSCNGERRKGLHLIRNKSPNMQDLKRRFKQVLSARVKSAAVI